MRFTTIRFKLLILPLSIVVLACGCRTSSPTGQQVRSHLGPVVPPAVTPSASGGFQIEQSQFGQSQFASASSQSRVVAQSQPSSFASFLPKVVKVETAQLQHFDEPMIQVAILLDDSGSMNGLIDQARSLIWTVVNGLTAAQKNGQDAGLQIALYHYGQRPEQLESFTKDLDAISESLFSLNTAGGTERCGEVIMKSVKELGWSADPQDLKLVVIAGNEPFTQGVVSYTSACTQAVARAIVVNSVYCEYSDSRAQIMKWRDGAKRTGGTFTTIDHNKKRIDVKAPQDSVLKDLNKQLNATFVSYTRDGKAAKSRQMSQDQSALSSGGSSYASRSVTKSGRYYSNSQWDLVDASKTGSFNWSSIDKSVLPVELQSMSEAELKQHVAGLAAERKRIQAEIKRVAAERNAFVAEERKRLQIEAGDEDFGSAFLEAARKIGRKRGFTF